MFKYFCLKCNVQAIQVVNCYISSGHDAEEIETPLYKCPICKEEFTEDKLEVIEGG